MNSRPRYVRNISLARTLAFLGLVLLCLPGIQAEESALPRNLDGREWYEQAVFQGRLYQAPLIMENDELIVFSDDRRIQRFSYRLGTRWVYDFDRPPLPGLLREGEKSVEAGLANGTRLRINSASGELMQRHQAISEFEPETENRPVHRFLVDGWDIVVFENSLVRLSSNSGQGVMFFWEAEAVEIEHAFLDDTQRLILIGPRGVYLYSLDGILLNSRNLDSVFSSENSSMYLSGGRLHLFNSRNNGFLILNPDLSIYLQGNASTPGRWYSAVRRAGGGVLSISFTSGELYLSDNHAVVHQVLTLEEQWNLDYIVREDNFLYLADNAWRVHRFDLSKLALELFSENFDFSAPGSTAEAVPLFLGNLLVSLIPQPAQLSRQLQGISRSLEEGQVRGRFLIWDRSLSLLSAHAYRESAAGVFSLADSSLRGAILRLLVSIGGGNSTAALLSALEAEISPDVFISVLDSLPEGVFPSEQAIIQRIRNFILRAEPWQRREDLVEALARRLFLIISDAPGGTNIRSDELKGEAAELLRELYGDFNSPDIRRRILGIGN